MEQLKDASFG
jgi:hypothetical protein